MPPLVAPIICGTVLGLWTVQVARTVIGPGPISLEEGYTLMALGGWWLYLVYTVSMRVADIHTKNR